MNTRIKHCDTCGGDKGFMGFDGSWMVCPACDGRGEYETILEPVTLEDLDSASADFLAEFKKSVASVNLLDGPRPVGKSKEWLDGQDRGLRQGLHIAETIVASLLEGVPPLYPKPDGSYTIDGLPDDAVSSPQETRS